jgi:predicted MFS family arabinose efflux permease
MEQRMSRRLVVVLAAACGLAAANLYYAQPLLPTIAHSLHVSGAAVGIIVTLTQVGYVLGLVFLVPLGDLLERRRLVVATLGVTTLALIAAALAPSLPVLVAAVTAIGVTSVIAQVLVPLAASLAGDGERGRVVGSVMSGLLIGVLLARSLAGAMAQLAGWRSIYWLAAAMMLMLAGVLWRALPATHTPVELSYPGLLRSVLELLRTEPVLRRRCLYGGCVFAAFQTLWATVAFLLAAPPFGYGELVIGLFGLLGAAGALGATVAGRVADRGHERLASGLYLALIVVSFAVMIPARHQLWPLVIGIVLLDLGVQGAQIGNQSAIYRLRPDARSRITTAYIGSYFVGGVAGSALASYVYDTFGWLGLCCLGCGFGALALLLWATDRSTARPAPASTDQTSAARSAAEA